MKQYVQAVLERHKTLEGSFFTEPYEAAWASEAIFFIHAEDIKGVNAKLSARIQISADGRDWIDEGTEFSQITASGSSFLRVSHFGGWLRLAGEVFGSGAAASVTIHLSLKE